MLNEVKLKVGANLAKINPKVRKQIMNLAMVTTMAIITTPPAYATASEMISRIIGTVLAIGTYIGAVLLAQGVFQLVMAFKDDNADSKSKAIMLILASIILVSLQTVYTSLMQGTSISVGTSLLD